MTRKPPKPAPEGGGSPPKTRVPGAPTSLADLQPHPRNPRSIDPEALAGLGASLEAFGDLAGITWNARTGHLVAGHQRLRALQEAHGPALELRPGPAGPNLYAPPGESYPIRVVDWPEDQELAALVAANAQTITGDWTPEVALVVADITLALPDLSAALHLGELVTGEPEPAPRRGATLDDNDPVDELAEAIRQTDEFLSADTNVARITQRLEAALHKRAEEDPAALNRAVLVLVPLGRGSEAVVLADPDLADAAQELRRLFGVGQSPLAALFARVLRLAPDS